MFLMDGGDVEVAEEAEEHYRHVSLAATHSLTHTAAQSDLWTHLLVGTIPFLSALLRTR